MLKHEATEERIRLASSMGELACHHAAKVIADNGQLILVLASVIVEAGGKVAVLKDTTNRLAVIDGLTVTIDKTENTVMLTVEMENS